MNAMMDSLAETVRALRPGRKQQPRRIARFFTPDRIVSPPGLLLILIGNLISTYTSVYSTGVIVIQEKNSSGTIMTAPELLLCDIEQLHL